MAVKMSQQVLHLPLGTELGPSNTIRNAGTHAVSAARHPCRRFCLLRGYSKLCSSFAAVGSADTSPHKKQTQLAFQNSAPISRRCRCRGERSTHFGAANNPQVELSVLIDLAVWANFPPLSNSNDSVCSFEVVSQPHTTSSIQ